MKKMLLRFLPNKRLDWKDFTKLSFFSLIQTLMFSINGFIDNLMAGNIYKDGMIVEGNVIRGKTVENLNEAALEGLGAAAQWWFIIVTIGTFFTGAVGFFTSQYFNKGDRNKTQRSVTTKLQIATLIALPIAIFVIIFPENFISAWTHKTIDKSHTIVALNNLNDDGTIKINSSYSNYLGAKYIRIAAISWLFWIFISPQNQSLRDVSKPQGGAIALSATLFTHVGLNFVFINTTNLGVEGPAIALLASRMVNLLVTALYVKLNKLPISIFANPFIWDKEIYLKWIKRWQYLLYAVVWTLAIAFRTFFWGLFFTKEDANSNAVDALVVLSIASAVQNIFLVAFDSLQPLFSKYVSGNMGKDKMKEAKAYADQIIGFGVLLSFFVSAILVGISFAVPYFGSDHLGIWKVEKNTLQQVKWCILVVALVYFSWVILASTRTIMSSGSRAGLMAIIDGSFTTMQTVWIVIIGVIHKYTGAFSNFGLAYLIFFLSDIFKLPFFLIPFYKLNWTKNHTKVSEEIIKVA